MKVQTSITVNVSLLIFLENDMEKSLSPIISITLKFLFLFFVNSRLLKTGKMTPLN